MICPLFAFLLLMPALPPHPAGEGVPASAAALFHEMDVHYSAGDTEGVVALFSPDYHAPFMVNSREELEAVTRRVLEGPNKARLESTILRGATIREDGLLEVVVDHRLRLGDLPMAVPFWKTYLLRPDPGGYKILFSVDQDPEGDRGTGGRAVEIPLLDLEIAAPEGWMTLPARRGIYLSRVLLLSPTLDRWVEASVVDPGFQDASSLLDMDLARVAGRLEEATDEEVVRISGIEGRRRSYVHHEEKGPDRRRWVTYLPRAGLFLRLKSETPLAVTGPDPSGALRIRLASSDRDLASEARRQYATGRLTGRRYRNKGAGVAFDLPRGWRAGVLAAHLEYKVQALGPGGEVFLAWGVRLPPPPPSTSMPRPGLRFWEQSGEEVLVDGKRGRRIEREGQASMVLVTGPGHVSHAFLVYAPRKSAETLDGILSTVRWEE